MKKLTVLLLVLFTLASPSLASETGVAEPDLFWYETDEAGVMNAVGVRFAVPEEAQDVVYRLPEDSRMAEMQFTLGSIAYVARIKPAAWPENISDVVYEPWALTDECMIGWCGATTYLTRDGENIVALCLWYDAAPGLMYSVTASSRDLIGLDIQAAAEKVYLPLQNDADGAPELSADVLLSVLTGCTGYAGTAGSSLKNARAAYELAAFANDYHLAYLDEQTLTDAAAGAAEQLTDEQKAELSLNLESIHDLLIKAFEDYRTVSDLFEDAGIGEESMYLMYDPLAPEHYSALYRELSAAGL